MLPAAGPDDLDRLLDLAVTAATAAGNLLLDGRHRDRADIGTKSSETDMVTEMDRAAEALVRQILLRRRPDDAVLGEEGGDDPGTSGVRWVVDPLDGTTNYLYGFPVFAVSIAAEIDGRAHVGVVHDPSRNETFTAVRGQGAFLAGRRLQIRGAPTLSTALVGTGFSYLSERRAWQAAVLGRVLTATRDVRRAGAASLDLCWVAAGRLDVFYEWGLQPWDVAAGGLIAAEAGALVGTLGGLGPVADTTIAAPVHLTAALRVLLEDATAAADAVVGTTA